MHITGDVECGDDFVGDTPEQRNQNFGCPGFPHPSICPNNGANGDMFMNYMDYTDDACMNIYTNGQRLRGRALFATGGPRAAFIDNYFRIVQPTTAINCIGTVRLNNPNCLLPNWTVVSGPATINSGQGTNQITLSATVSGTVSLRATADNYISEINIDVTRNLPSIDESGYIVDGIYKPIQIWSGSTFNYNEICKGHTATTQFSIPGASSVTWTRTYAQPTNTVWWQNGEEISLFFYELNQSSRFQINASNACGSFVQTYGFRSKECSGGCYRYSVSPNPAKESVSIAVNNIPPPCDPPPTEKSSGLQTTISEIRIYDNSGTLKQVQKVNKLKQARVKLNGYKMGVYVVEIIDGEYKERQQVVINE
jgi:hypothetical protein